MYRLLKDLSGQIRTDAILRVADNAFIPFDPENKDYQDYLKWLADGNTPIAAG